MTRRAVLAAAALLLVSAGLALAATVSVRVGNFYFEDATVGDGRIVANVGDRLRFVVEDNGNGTPHSVEVDELGIHSGSLARGDVYTTPQLSKAGTFPLYCRPHVNRGHETTLIVLASNPTPGPNPTPSLTQPSDPTPRPSSASSKAPTSPPAATATPSEGPQSSAGQLPSEAPESSEAPDSSNGSDAGGIIVGGPVAGPTAGPTAGPGDISPPSDGAEGVVRTWDMVWLRSFVVGLLSLPPLAVVAFMAIHRSGRRSGSAAQTSHPAISVGGSANASASEV